MSADLVMNFILICWITSSLWWKTHGWEKLVPWGIMKIKPQTGSRDNKFQWFCSRLNEAIIPLTCYKTASLKHNRIITGGIYLNSNWARRVGPISLLLIWSWINNIINRVQILVKFPCNRIIVLEIYCLDKIK